MNWIELNGTSLRYELSGSGKTTLVLVHEMGGTLDSWDQVLPALNNTRQVLRYDTRGAGLSEKINGTVTFDDMADDLAALLDATRHRGQGRAGRHGGRWRHRYPLRRASRGARRRAGGDQPGHRRRRGSPPGHAGSRRDSRDAGHACAGGGRASPIPIRRRSATTPRSSANSARAGWPTIRESFAAINRMLADSTVTEELPRIACPTLVIACTHDRLRPPSAVEPMAKQIPGAEYLEINSGHFAGIQTPGLVSQAFHGFLFAHGY